MAILKSADGRFYDVPDKDAEKYVIPAEQVRDRLDAAGISPPTGGGPAGDSATIVIKVLGGSVSGPKRGGVPAVAAYHHCHNCGRGCGRNCGHGCGHHCH